jgi:adenylate kinase family enzyme
LSGPVGAGKSAVADALVEHHAHKKISTSSHLTRLAREKGFENERAVLQELGDDLDLQTGYLWPIDVAKVQIAADMGITNAWLLDSVRKAEQVAHFRGAFQCVVHAHLVAPEAVLIKRYEARQAIVGSRDSRGTYQELIAHPNEISSRALEHLADLVFDTSQTDAQTVAKSISQNLRRGNSCSK